MYVCMYMCVCMYARMYCTVHIQLYVHTYTHEHLHRDFTGFPSAAQLADSEDQEAVLRRELQQWKEKAVKVGCSSRPVLCTHKHITPMSPLVTHKHITPMSPLVTHKHITPMSPLVTHKHITPISPLVSLLLVRVTRVVKHQYLCANCPDMLYVCMYVCT